MKNAKSIMAAAACAAVALNAAPLAVHADESNFSGYVLMNIPYSEFYAAENAEIGDVDAISSATNKVGNYGKAGGAYHSGTTAEVAGDGTVTAVGTQNGAKVQGVTWAVKADSLDAVKALGGVEITDETSLTTATYAKGSTTSNTLVGYETLTEAPSYSYYVLDSEPENYLVLNGLSFTAGVSSATVNTINAEISYSTNWGDVQIDLSEAEDANGKIINAMIVTADDGTTKGFYHLDQIWAYNELAWEIAATPELDGKTVTNIRYYCSDKDTDLTDGTAPAYANYVYDYKLNLDILTVYTGEVTAEFTDSTTISISGLPDDIENPSATVSSVVARGETSVVIADSTAVSDGVITTTDAAVFETSYKVVVASDNYGDISITVPCNVEESGSQGVTTGTKETNTAITTTTTTTAAANGKTTTTTAATSNPKTGDAGLAVPAALLTMAGASAIVFKKRS